MPRFFGNLRRELLDHVIVWNVGHLARLLAEYAGWYENHRLRQRLEGNAPNSRDTKEGLGRDGKIVSIPVLGGLHHRSERKAAWTRVTGLNERHILGGGLNCN